MWEILQDEWFTQQTNKGGYNLLTYVLNEESCMKS